VVRGIILSVRKSPGEGHGKFEIAMADEGAIAPSVQANGLDDAEAGCGRQGGAPCGWWVSLP
jgi:hypothetical protein